MTDGWRRSRCVAGVLVVAALSLLGVCLRRARERARDVPLSPLVAGLRVGPTYVERRDIAGDGTAVGQLDDLGDFARPGFDPESVHPEVRRFYERSADYRMTYTARWHRGFRLGAALASRLTGRLEQLDVAVRGGERRLESRFVPVDPAADPREGARAWIRTDVETGAAVFVAVYAAYSRDVERYVNIAVPLPWSNLSTVLSVGALDADPTDTGLELTTLAPGDPGLYLATPLGEFAVPLDQRFRVWPVGAPGAPADPTGEAALVATHEMWVCGRRFLTVEYAMARERATSVGQTSTSTS